MFQRDILNSCSNIFIFILILFYFKFSGFSAWCIIILFRVLTISALLNFGFIFISLCLYHLNVWRYVADKNLERTECMNSAFKYRLFRMLKVFLGFSKYCSCHFHDYCLALWALPVEQHFASLFRPVMASLPTTTHKQMFVCWNGKS